MINIISSTSMRMFIITIYVFTSWRFKKPSIVQINLNKRRSNWRLFLFLLSGRAFSSLILESLRKLDWVCICEGTPILLSIFILWIFMKLRAGFLLFKWEFNQKIISQSFWPIFIDRRKQTGREIWFQI